MIKTTSPSLTSTKCKYMRKDTILPLLASLVPQPPVLEGHRDPTDRLWKIPSKQYYEPAPAPADKQQRHEVNSVYHQKNLKDLVTFLHDAAAGSPTPPHGYPPLKKDSMQHGPDSLLNLSANIYHHLEPPSKVTSTNNDRTSVPLAPKHQRN